MTMRIYQLSKKLLRLSNNVEKLLSGITTNTLDAPRNAFIDVKGKIIATVEQQRSGTDEIVLLVEFLAALQLRPHLERYRALSKTLIEDDTRPIFYDLDGTIKPPPDALVFPQTPGQIIIADEVPGERVSDEAFTCFRLDHSLPIHGLDYHDGMLLNINQEVDYISYDKGCYLGQEIIARVHFKSRPPKRLVVANEAEVPEALRETMTSRVTDADNGQTRGFVFLPNRE